MYIHTLSWPKFQKYPGESISSPSAYEGISWGYGEEGESESHQDTEMNSTSLTCVLTGVEIPGWNGRTVGK
jgi:hypothetical protein